MHLIRKQELFKLPGVAETLDWAEALLALNTDELDAKIAEQTLGCILKYKSDTDKILGNEMAELLKQANLIVNSAESDNV